MEDDDEDATPKHDKVDKQVSAACLQSFAVQHFALAGQTHHRDPTVGDDHAADGGGEQHHCEGEAVHVIDHHTVTGELKQRGIVTEWVGDESSAVVKPDGQTQQDPHQHQRNTPGRDGQLYHHSVGHDGRVAKRVANCHVAVEGHDHEHSVWGGSKHVSAEGLDHTFIVGDEALGRGPQQVHQQTGDHDGITKDVINW